MTSIRQQQMVRTVLHVRVNPENRGLAAGDAPPVERVSTATAAREAVADGGVTTAVVEVDECGLEPVDAVRDVDPAVPVIACSASADGELAAAATRRGADEYYPRESADQSLAGRVRAHLPGREATAADGTVTTDGTTTAPRDSVVAYEAAVGTGTTLTERASDGDEQGVSNTLELYAETLEAVDDGVYALDDEGEFVFVNEAMTDLTGYSREELLGEHTSIIKDDGTVEKAEQTLRELLRGKASETTFDLELQPRSGESFPCEDHMVMLTDGSGQFTGTAGVIRDTTDRKRRQRRLSRLLETSRELVGTHEREEVARVVAERTADALGQDRSVVRLYDEERDALVPTARGSDDPTVRDRPVYAVGEGGPGRAFETGETLRLGRDVDPDEVREATGDGGVGDTTEAVYVRLGEHGVLTLATTDPDGFEDATVSMAEVLASTAAVALERADREADLLRYRTVIENVQDMVYVLDAEGRFSLVTEPLAEWLGYDREELVGATPADVMSEADIEAVESVVDDLRASGDADVSERIETQAITADGQRRPAELEVSLVPSDAAFAGTVGVVRDLSELVRARELLETERDRFSYLFDNLPDAVVEATLEEDGRPVVQAVNDAFVDQFGYEADQVVGNSLNEFVLPEAERETGRELDRKASAGERPSREVRRRTADGFREFLFRGVPYEAGENGTRSFGIYTDITARKQRERRLEVLNRILRHNIRNDVNVILGYAEILADRVEDESLSVRASDLREKAAELTALSDRARSLDRTMRRGSPRDSTVSLATLVDDVVADYAAEYPSLTVESDVADVRVVGDGRLALAVEELLENVVDHAGAGATVRIESEGTGSDVRLRVADDGPGIPDHERTVVEGSTEITQLEHGSGLGLWVVRWVCESCGGRLRFEESGLGGSAVVLSLTSAED
jgi:PAS domain S-box-containing protein